MCAVTVDDREGFEGGHYHYINEQNKSGNCPGLVVRHVCCSCVIRFGWHIMHLKVRRNKGPGHLKGRSQLLPLRAFCLRALKVPLNAPQGQYMISSA